MLIDRFMPTFEIKARYQIDVKAPAPRAYAVARHLDMGDSLIVRGLCRLRGLPPADFTLEGMSKLGFVLLADKPSQEIVFGLVGRFWTPYPRMQRIKVDDFVAFNRPGFAKAVGNMAFTPLRDGQGVRVTTETRIHCP